MIPTRFLTVMILVAGMGMAGCTGPERKPAVPDGLSARAVIPGLENVRYRPDIDVETVQREGLASYRREQDYLAAQGHSGPPPPANFLAVSGGGDNGAFGAGLLVGWSEAGDRPSFKLVTGVSTGALIAPFAFLGPDYDQQLQRLYTTITPDDILTPRPLLEAITSDAMADNEPLFALVSREIDAAFLRAVAAEYRKGRILLVATVDLDARQSVMWNMTRIASIGGDEALQLFRSIMVASAAIPGAFPPVMIDVEVDGAAYQEMHVDGGTMSQVFVYPPALHIKEVMEEMNESREQRVYIIRNSRLDPEWSSVERSTVDIATRAISSLIQTQGIGDLYTIYTATQRDGIDFNLAYIPASFEFEKEEEFDPEFMRALFDVGRSMARKGFPWEQTPPGF